FGGPPAERFFAIACALALSFLAASSSAFFCSGGLLGARSFLLRSCGEGWLNGSLAAAWFSRCPFLVNFFVCSRRIGSFGIWFTNATLRNPSSAESSQPRSC